MERLHERRSIQNFPAQERHLLRRGCRDAPSVLAGKRKFVQKQRLISWLFGEARRNPALNAKIGMLYLGAADPKFNSRTWQDGYGCVSSAWGHVPKVVEKRVVLLRQIGHDLLWKNKPKHRRTPLKKQYRGLCQEATSKSKQNHLGLECVLPMAELIEGMRAEIESCSAELGLQLMGAVMEQEIEARLGDHGAQSHYRHGQQPGYVVYGGRKTALARPRMRAVEGKEARLKSYHAFQEDGKMQRAVARQFLRQVSTRNYEGALDDCLQGYGIKKSSVSRQWQAASAAALKKLCFTSCFSGSGRAHPRSANI